VILDNEIGMSGDQCGSFYDLLCRQRFTSGSTTSRRGESADPAPKNYPGRASDSVIRRLQFRTDRPMHARPRKIDADKLFMGLIDGRVSGSSPMCRVLVAENHGRWKRRPSARAASTSGPQTLCPISVE
jgi:hypothetical protein